MMAWPAYIHHAFSQVDPSSADAASYYGPYNVLLNHLFPASQGFEVTPMPQPGHDSTLLFAVRKLKYPVVFLDVRAPTSAPTTPTSCVQEAITDMSHALFKVPCKIKGISAFGPRYIVYEYEYDAAANELDARAGAPALVERGEQERDVRSADGAESLIELARSVGATVPEA